MAPAVAAQGVDSLRVQVVQLAGATFYVSAGAQAGLEEGGALWVARLVQPGDSVQASVVSVSDRRGLLTFASGSLPLVRGDSLSLKWTSGTGGPRVAGASGEQRGTQPTGRFDHPRSAPAVRGWISMDVAAMRSSTASGIQPGGGSSGPPFVERDFITPTTRLEAEARGLPAGVTARTRLRASYRHGPGGLIPQTASVRVYELAVEKKFDRVPVELLAGRFHNPHEHFSGYWDGIMARLGSGGLGVGGAVGYQPATWNEGVDTQRPKASVFVDYRDHGEMGIADGVVSVQHVGAPDGAPQRTYLGWSQTLRSGRLRAAHSIQVDRDPATRGWTVSDLLLAGSVQATPAVHLRTRWSHRRPFYYWRSSALVGYRRDDIGVGATWTWNGGVLSVDALGHNAENADGWTSSLGSTVRLYPDGPLRLGWSASAMAGAFGFSDVATVALGADRRIRSTDARLGYRFYASRSAFFDAVTHEINATVGGNLRPGIRGLFQLGSRFGSGLEATRVHVSLTRAF